MPSFQLTVAVCACSAGLLVYISQNSSRCASSQYRVCLRCLVTAICRTTSNPDSRAKDRLEVDGPLSLLRRLVHQYEILRKDRELCRAQTARERSSCVQPSLGSFSLNFNRNQPSHILLAQQHDSTINHRLMLPLCQVLHEFTWSCSAPQMMTAPWGSFLM